MKANELPPSLQPREKALLYGIEQLNDVDLLALVIGRGIKGCNAIDLANKMLSEFGGIDGLANTPATSLERIDGINKIRALQFSAIFEMAKRMSNLQYGDTFSTTKENIIEYARKNSSTNEESFMVLSLSKNLKLLNRLKIGGQNDGINVLVDDILRHIVASKAASYMILHNHPSGNIDPSKTDLSFTLSLKAKTDVLSIQLIDHYVVCNNDCYSFREHYLI